MQIYRDFFCLAFLILCCCNAQDFPDRPTEAYPGWRDLKLTTVDRYVFEGINYADLSKKSQKREGDCFGQFQKCILMEPMAFMVCSYRYRTRWYWDMPTVCQVGLFNCELAKSSGYGIYGKSHLDSEMLVEGDGMDCNLAGVRRNMLLSGNNFRPIFVSAEETTTASS